MPALQTTIGRGVLSARPAAGTAGALYFATDTSVWYRDNGSSWDNQNPTAGSSGGVTNAGNAASLQVGTDAGKGAAGTAGRIWLASDTGNAYYDNGSSWIDVATVQWANLTGKPSTFAPSAHQTSHLSGGSDAIGGLAQTQVDVDATEASTNDSLVAGNLRTNMRRIRYQLAQLGTGAWNTLVAMVQLSPGSQQSGTINVSGEVQGSDFKPGGVTGATAAARYHAATATGHPTSGTWAVGDIVPDQTGTFWFCTVAGTPGTWVQVGGTGGGGGGGSSTLAGDTDVSISSPHGGQVLGYSDALSKWVNQQVAGVAATTQTAQLGADVSIASNTLTDILTITLPPGTWLLLGSAILEPAVATYVVARIWDGTTTLAQSENVPSNAYPFSHELSAVVTPTATTTYKISAYVSGTTGTARKQPSHSASGNTATYLQAIQLSGNPVGQTAPAVRCYNSANISVANATVQALTFDTNRFDQGAATAQHSTSSNTSRLVCQQAGVYQITANAEVASNGTGQRLLILRLNGTTEIARDWKPGSAGSAAILIVTTEYQLNVGDYIEACAYQDSGGALNVIAATNRSPEFGMARIDSGPGAVQPNTKVQLDYEPATDIINGLTLTASTWVDLTSNQTFTVDDANSLIEVDVNGMIMAGNTASATQTGVRINIDSGGTPYTKMLCGSPYMGAGPGANNYINILSGASPVSFTGLSAGSHTIKLQAYTASNASTAYCRPSSAPNLESLSIRVLERKQSTSPPSSTPAPAVRCYNSGAQSTTSGTTLVLSWDTTELDQGTSTAQHSTASNTSRLTCQQAGVYQITGNVNFTSNATGERYADIRLNGSNVLAVSNLVSAVSAGDDVFITVTTTRFLAVGDYVELRAFQSSGGALTVQGGQYNGTSFSMARIDSGGQGFVPIPMVKTSNYTILNTDSMVVAGATGLTFTLPAASTRAPGMPLVVKNDNFTATTIARAGSDTIDGATSYALPSAYQSITLVGDGVATWRII